MIRSARRALPFPISRLLGTCLTGAGLAVATGVTPARADWTALPSNQPTWQAACDTIATDLRGGTLIDVQPIYDSSGKLWGYQCDVQISAPPTVYHDVTKPSCSGTDHTNAASSTGCVAGGASRKWAMFTSQSDQDETNDEGSSCKMPTEPEASDAGSAPNARTQEASRVFTGNAVVGNPLNLATGNKRQEIVDFTTPGPDTGTKIYQRDARYDAAALTRPPQGQSGRSGHRGRGWRGLRRARRRPAGRARRSCVRRGSHRRA